MINQVDRLIEELKKFNPEARLNPVVKLSFKSPATECEISSLLNRTDDAWDDLTDEVNAFEENIEKLIAEIEKEGMAERKILTRLKEIIE